MDPFEKFNQVAESNRGNYDPFSAFNKFAGMEQMVPTSKSITAQNPDEHWPLVKINIPGSKAILVRALPLENVGLLPFSIFIRSNNVKITPGIIAGFVPDNIFSEIKTTPLNDLYIWAQCTSSEGQITSVTLKSGSSCPSPQSITANAPPSTLNIPIGMVQKGTNETFNFIAANWVTPYSVLQYSTIDNSGIVTNWYSWVW
jgi:hypothetical protein